MEKPIILKNKRGKQLIGMLHLPKAKGRFPLVIICHGLGGTKTSRYFVRLARALEKEKISTFRFDFEGCGDSEGNLEKTTIKKQVQDLDSVINLIKRQRNVNKDKIAFLGHSLGCVVLVTYVSQNKIRAKTLIFWSPALNQRGLFRHLLTPYSLRKWKKERYQIHKDKKFGIQYLKENENEDYSPLLSEIKIPILIIHGRKDETVPIKFSKKLVRDYKNIRLIVLPRAGHKFRDYYAQQKLIRETVKWLKKYLGR